MRIGLNIHHASGLSHDDVHFLVSRFDARIGLVSEASDNWILRFIDRKVHRLWGGTAWYTGLWRSPNGRVYVTAANQGLLVNTKPEVRAAPFHRERLAGTLAGVWGLDDRFVLAWGIVKRGNKMTGILFRYDGRSWREMESPGQVYGMHGLSPRLVYAVGRQGLIARWDGKKWHRQRSPTKGALSAVFVASEDEIYAAGDPVLLKGSVKGWEGSVEAPNHLFGVAKWKDIVWVGGAQAGLLKLQGDALVPADRELKAERLEARGELIVSSPDAVAFTPDLKTFKKLKDRGIEKTFEGEPPQWIK